MAERILLLTGHLAEPRLKQMMNEFGREGLDWEIADIGVKVAALMTEEIIRRRLPRPVTADRVILPGRVRADLDRLAAEFGVPFERGPDEIVDIPTYFGRGGRRPDLTQHDTRIFAEIVDAPDRSIESILDRARAMRTAGADVIDLGCLPDTPFAHLEEAIQALKAEGFAVSIDSGNLRDLERGAGAGADYLFSLDESNLDLAGEVAAIPVIVPARHGDLDSLVRACEKLDSKGLPYLADPVLDPIHFGFMESLARYAAFRRLKPDAEMLMGTGNLTELTGADTAGITAMLMGIVSELRIRNVLVVQVSPHTRRTIEEHDAARRAMFAARRDGNFPKGYGDALLALHDLRPFASTSLEIASAAAAVRDANFRIETAQDGIHVYNRDVHLVGTDAMSLFAGLGVERDGAHAFYLGAELAKAEIAWRLGKRYSQDEPLDWGCAADLPEEDEKTRLKAPGHTLVLRRSAS